MQIAKKTFLGICAISVVAGSCVRESIEPQSSTGSTREAVITLSMSAVQEYAPASGSKAQSRAATPDVDEGISADYKVTDFWLLQYNDKGLRIGSPHYYLMDDFADGSISVPVILPEGEEKYKCVIIANTHDESFMTQIGEATTIEMLKTVRRKIRTQDDLSVVTQEGGRDLLMNCVTEVDRNTVALDCALYRNVAKLSLTLKNATESKVTVRSVQLRSVPDGLVYADRLYHGAQEPSPTTGESGFLDMDPEEFSDGLVPGSSIEINCYLPRNCRGKNDSGSPQQKNVNAPLYATFVEIIAEDETGTPLRYRFYPGENMTNDFNIVPNRNYILPITIAGKGDSSTDSRVEELGTVVFGEEANSYIINPLNGPVQRMYAVPVTGRINEFWSNEGEDYSAPIDASTEWVAEVIWQDKPQRLIHFCKSDGQLSGDTFEAKGLSYLRFKPESGASGNVLIGVRKKDDVSDGSLDRQYLWSWHLWITDYNPDSYKGSWIEGTYTYKVDGGVIHRYAGDFWNSECENRFIMDRNLGAMGASGENTAAFEASCGFYYQYGRKDPFPGKLPNLYDITGAVQTNFTPSQGDCILRVKGTTRLTTSVQYPYAIYHDIGEWMLDNEYAANQWNNPVWNEDSGKSLFDPCPPGWKTPEMGTFDILGKPDGTPNAKGEFSSGYNFYISSEGHGDTAWFPAAGLREDAAGGNLTKVMTAGYFWFSTTHNYKPSSRTMIFTSSGSVQTRGVISRGHGQSMRCIRE